MTLPSEYFDALYEGNDDPWSFRTRWYESRKRRLTLAALPAERYERTFEPGCSIGILTKALATRSELVVAMDVSATALQHAAHLAPRNVELCQGAVPACWPAGQFDLVVLSEVGYYLDQADCAVLADRAADSTRDLVAVHWRHPVADYPMCGDDVHELLGSAARSRGLIPLVSHVESDFRLEVWSSDSRSVAAREGLVPT
jgi:Methyltransferase domain